MSVRLLCCLLLNHWAKSNQLWCVSYSHEWGVPEQNKLPGEGSQGEISLNFNNKVNFKDFFISNFVRVLTNETYNTYQRGIFILSPGSCPRGGNLWGWGAHAGEGVTKIKNGQVAYQIDGDDKQKIYTKEKFSP